MPPPAFESGCDPFASKATEDKAREDADVRRALLETLDAIAVISISQVNDSGAVLFGKTRE
jgi:hypothetical protein